MIYKYFGPPGTGKTHKLISRAKAYVKIKTPLNKIGYFAFTRKAAEEARKRMPADDNKLLYFQTLHSFAFNLLDLKEEDIMQPYHYEKFGKDLNVKVNYYDRYNKEETHFLTCDNPYFQLIHRSINRCVDIREEFDRGEHNSKEVQDWTMLEHIYSNYLEYKNKKKMMDFNDMIELLIEKQNKIPEFDVVFIDEAQDLSPLQWKLYDILKQKRKDIYLAGDDDQAIFAWAGADVNRFINEPAKEKVLIYSKRISKAVQEQSQLCIENIVGPRKTKKYYPRNFDGVCEEIANLDQIDLSKGKWLILTRTVSRLLKIEDYLKKNNLYFESNRGKSIKKRLFKAIKNYNLLQKGYKLEEKDMKEVEEYSGIKVDIKKDWYDSFQNVEQEDKDYLLGLLESGEDLEKPARIWLSTIHAAKGGEEDNVILCLDMGDKIIRAIKKSEDKQDEEHKVWYVGVTRARNNLYKLKARIKRKGYKLDN